jgi:ATP-binding cassette subfamily B protein
MASSILICIIQFLEIIMMQRFFDGVTAVAGGGSTYDNITRLIIQTGLVFLMAPIIELFEYLSQGYFYRRGNGYMTSQLHLKVGEKPLIEFDKTETYDMMEKAKIGAQNLPSASRTAIQCLLYFFPFFILISLYLFSVAPLLVAILILLYATTLFSEKYKSSMYYNFQNTTISLKRRVDGFLNSIVSKEFFKETRTSGAFSYLIARYKKHLNEYGREKMYVEKKVAKREGIMRLVNAAGYIGIIALLLFYLVNGSISVGIFAAVYYSIDKINRCLKNMFQQIGETMKEMATTKHLFNYLEDGKEPKSVLSSLKNTDIHLKNVSFSYTSSEKNVLKDINLTIHQGETLAIVGENGAGKSTLIKLITGLYQPKTGSVLYGCHPTSEYSTDALQKPISGIFQDFIKYKMTLKENIIISDMESGKPLDEVISVANVNMDKFPDGLETLLSREFGGIDISGGEWQRIAIARGLYRSCDLIILDEPTAAIDPLEETRIFRLFEKATTGKTTILVTHRLGSAKIADKIVVLDNGRIAEYGTHELLLKQKGIYYTMYREQSKWYVR